MTPLAAVSALDLSATAPTLEEAFPQADPGVLPFGSGVLVQLRTPRKFTSAGIALPGQTQDQEKWMTTIGRMVAVGPLAFKDRDDPGRVWPEGIWAQVGDYVRCPKWGGDRWEIDTGKTYPGDREKIMARFVIYRDRELIGKITCDPLSLIDYV